MPGHGALPAGEPVGPGLAGAERVTVELMGRAARAVGMDAATVRGLPDLEAVSAWVAGGRRRPLLLDAKVTPTVVGEWLEEAFRGH